MFKKQHKLVYCHFQRQ